MSTEAKETVGETENAIEGSKKEMHAIDAGGEAVKVTQDKTQVGQVKQQTEETTVSRPTLTGSAVKSQTGEITIAELVQLFNQHRMFLEEHIDPYSGILDNLLASETLTNKEIRDIKKYMTVDEINSRLLDYILQKNKCDQFIRTLSEEKQIHIVNYLLSDGERKPEFGSEWPLTQEEVKILNRNQKDLVNLLDTCDLIGRLFSCGVISMRQWNFIASKQPAYEKNEALLEILRRSSLNAYWQTIRCLHQSNQSNIAKILAEGGALARVDVNLEGEGLNVSQAEAEVIEGITNLLGNRPLPERSRIYELVELNLAGNSLRHSVSLYFHCLGLSDLERIEHLLENGRLKDIVETVFNRFTSALVRVNLKSATDSFKTCREFFTAISTEASTLIAEALQQHTEYLVVKIDPDSGLLDKLQLNSRLSFKEISDIKHQDPFYKRNSLLLKYIIAKMEYDSLINALRETWQTHIANFLIANGQYIPEKFGDDWPLTESELSVLDGNEGVLIDLIEPGDLVDRLHSRGVINMTQRDAIFSKLSRHKKNEALLEILRRRSLKDFKTTIRCLRESNQSHLAEILKHGEEIQIREGSKHVYFPKKSKDKKSELPAKKESSEIRFQAVIFPAKLTLTAEKFQQHIEFLEEMIDPDSGLLDILLANKTLSSREISDIRGQHQFYKRNSRLLQYIRDKKKYDCLIDALKEAGQSHIANFLIADGEYVMEKFSDDWPLTKTELSILYRNQEVLIDLIEPGDLIGRLHSKGVINRRQREAISSKLACHEKNEALLEILRRRSLKDFKTTIQCLRESNQSIIAEVLEQRGGLEKEHAEGLDDKTEDEIIAALQNILRNKSPEERRRILQTIDLDVISAKKGE